MAKMKTPWIALCSAAIGAIYTAGYITTDNHVNAQPVSNFQSVQQTQVNTQPVAPVQATKQTQTNTQSSKVSVKSIYKDGTYTGSGSNRRGSIAVNVTIKNDKITDVTISDFGMHYSESDIDGLPSEVVQKQSAEVTNVSGATYSTEAFQDAVQDALTQARNA